AMQAAAETHPGIAARIELFRYRVPEEFYDLKNDPDCLHNLIDRPDLLASIELLQTQLVAHMTRTNDPMLPAFQNRTDRAAVDEILLKTYGPPQDSAKKKRTKKKAEKKQKDK
ncbi:MAG: sulfatase, partial [Fuerstiella sp.]